MRPGQHLPPLRDVQEVMQGIFSLVLRPLNLTHYVVGRPPVPVPRTRAVLDAVSELWRLGLKPLGQTHMTL